MVRRRGRTWPVCPVDAAVREEGGLASMSVTHGGGAYVSLSTLQYVRRGVWPACPSPMGARPMLVCAAV